MNKLAIREEICYRGGTMEFIRYDIVAPDGNLFCSVYDKAVAEKIIAMSHALV